MRKADFIKIPPKGNGAYKFKCPKGHIVNCLLENKPLDYSCPVCQGLRATIAGNLNKLNKKRGQLAD